MRLRSFTSVTCFLCATVWGVGLFWGIGRVAAQAPSRSFAVYITDESQQPVEGASAEVRGQRSDIAFKCTTNAEGDCSVGSLPQGQLQLSVQGPFHNLTSRTMDPTGQLNEQADGAEWHKAPGAVQMSANIEIVSKVAKARAALFDLKLAATRLLQSGRFQEGIDAISRAIGAFNFVAAVDRRSIVLVDGIEILTLAGSLRLHLGGGLDKASEYIGRAQVLTSELSNRKDIAESYRRTPDSLLRAEAMLEVQRGNAVGACQVIERAAKEQAWLKSDDSDPMLSNEGDAQWWSENHLLEEFRDLAVSVALLGSHPDVDCSNIALRLTLASKGRVLDATTRKILWLREGVPIEYQRYVSELQEVWDQQSLIFIKQARDGVGRRELEEFVKTPPWRRGDAPKSAEAQAREQLRDRESKLLSLLLPVRKKVEESAVADRAANIRKRLPGQSAVIEFCLYRPYTGRAAKDSSESIYDEDRYGAFVIRGEQRSELVDLGDAGEIDELAAALLESAALGGDPLDDEAFESALKDYRAMSARVFQRAMLPLMSKIKGVKHLIIGPARGLANVPFAALTMPAGTYMAEEFLITYVASANDLLPRGPAARRQTTSILIGAPDFGHNADPQKDIFDADSVARTRSEVRSIRAQLGEGSVYTGSAASKPLLSSAHGPRILHLATHAFADNDVPDSSQLDSNRYLAAEILGFDRSVAIAPERPEEHLLRPRVALARANSEPEKGIMSGGELSHLDLFGTELAVLSACQTGLGVIRNDEGVYSLRRALAIAGSRTQVTTLWSVDDVATEKVMVAFYSKLSSGRGEALRQAQLQLARGSDLRMRHPYFWAGLQLSGDWSALQPSVKPTTAPGNAVKKK